MSGAASQRPTGEAARRTAWSRPAWGRGLAFAGLAAYSAWLILPVVWMVASSFKDDAEIFRHTLGLLPAGHLRIDHYAQAWRQGQFGAFFANSVLVTGASVVLILALGAPAAYALTRMNRGRGRFVRGAFIAGLMIPAQLAVVPLFYGLRAIGLLDTRPGLILVYTANGLPFAVFVLAAFFRSLPPALYEAAIIDGCGEGDAFARVMLPLAAPGLVTVAIFQFIGIWKEYFYAFMIAGGDPTGAASTLPLGLANLSITAEYRSEFGVLFAGLVIAIVPILAVYLPLQKRIVKGIAAGAVKG